MRVSLLNYERNKKKRLFGISDEPFINPVSKRIENVRIKKKSRSKKHPPPHRGNFGDDKLLNLMEIGRGKSFVYIHM